MKNIRFDFTCSRQVPLYAHLCNQYLNYDALNINIGCDAQHHLGQDDFGPITYFIEAKGEQAQLEQLADAIAADFLISTWLIDSGINVIDEPQGSKILLPYSQSDSHHAIAAFCQQCYPLIGDNQSAKFGTLDLVCPCCHGEMQLTPAQKALTLSDIKTMAQGLLTQGPLTLAAADELQLSLTPFDLPLGERPQLLICNPNTLNAHFCLNDAQVLALSSIEKPLICARPTQEHDKLSAPLYDICFAYSRVILVLTEVLRQRGVDWVYIRGQHNRSKLAWVEGAWAQLTSYDLPPITKQFTAPEPLRDEISFLGFKAQWQAVKKSRAHQGTLTVQIDPLDKGETAIERLASAEDHSITDAALFATLLNGKFTSQKQAKNAAAIYLSHSHPSQIVTCDNKGDTALFFALPTLPDNGYEIFHQLDSSPQKAVAQKFKSLFPEDYLKLLSLKLHGRRDNLQSLWAIAAILIGLNKDEETHSQEWLSDALMATAMRYHGANAPRIDYPLTKGEAHRSLNWCKTLGTVLSFRVAGNDDPSQLAFAMQDSLADYLANWLEHIDLNIGVHNIALAGNDLANETLCKRIRLRLGKNFPLVVNRSLDLDGDNLAVGALYVKQRKLNEQA
ncbi:NiFe hydrogenase [Shewanella sp. CG12_big_fil_rev_8_21_14_0_65_47_15]|uniref:NiFe hydrogenase n=1 Tax=Shewanella sp. CG12_big_fil_rev_8_21_14_0_65_47_15 TaxID=1975537 RepID=UPI000CB019A6|nr:NiFe hydrogenase [Shewanella sp. CG12_big_fil_rev_8_21_14_0_65_47_15]PIW59577.1 MAG: NiFe hydrogenase [Shewanella sp. CG12_big_fil_rev_8_21_14_0_65_47_15]